MFTILITDTNELIVTKKERIMQRSKLVDSLHFLADQTYKNQDMSKYTVVLEYLLPTSKKYCNEKYEDKLEYALPIDTSLTSEAGEVEVQITFLLSDLDEEGQPVQRVRKTSSCLITVVPISAWADVIPDSALTPLDQRLIKQDAQIKALDEFNQFLIKTKADNIVFTDSKLQLTSQGARIGDAVTIPNAAQVLLQGVPATDFDAIDTLANKESNSAKVIEF